MRDGLYQVTVKSICAGFTIKNGRLDLCAPILRKQITYWYRSAVLIKEDPQPATLFD